MNLERNRDEQKLPENPPENRKKNVTLGEALVAATKAEMGLRGEEVEAEGHGQTLILAH